VQFSSNSIDHLPTHYIVGIFPLRIDYETL
jgi:hypothetical protein